MKTIRLTLSFFIATLLFCSAQAQNTGTDYRTAVGVKIYPGAITVKHFLKDNAALEGLGTFWDKGFRITGLYEFHMQLLQVEGLRWYVGPGAHIGFYDEKNYEGKTLFGVDGVLGVDYKIKGVPINLSLDWQPSFEFGNGADYESWGGLGIRFAF